MTSSSDDDQIYLLDLSRSIKDEVPAQFAELLDKPSFNATRDSRRKKWVRDISRTQPQSSLLKPVKLTKVDDEVMTETLPGGAKSVEWYYELTPDDPSRPFPPSHHFYQTLQRSKNPPTIHFEPDTDFIGKFDLPSDVRGHLMHKIRSEPRDPREKYGGIESSHVWSNGRVLGKTNSAGSVKKVTDLWSFKLRPIAKVMTESIEGAGSGESRPQPGEDEDQADEEETAEVSRDNETGEGGPSENATHVAGNVPQYDDEGIAP